MFMCVGVRYSFVPLAYVWMLFSGAMFMLRFAFGL